MPLTLFYLTVFLMQSKKPLYIFFSHLLLKSTVILTLATSKGWVMDTAIKVPKKALIIELSQEIFYLI